MKIVCDACSAKYSISDDKVQGKVFKIRCKKCSNIIVVRGNAGATAAAEPTQLEKDTRVFDYGYDDNSAAESVWHVVIDQDQVGPLTASEVQKRFTDGEIDSETYIWREGFADWLPMNQVDTFASLFGTGDTASHDDSGSLFGDKRLSGPAAGGDLFAPSLERGESRGESRGAAADDDGDVFAARRPAAAVEPQAKLRGERGENSVLFSLSNLAQLASDGPRPQSTSSSAAMAGSAQHGGGEGSGLIDIRSMASAYRSPSSPKSASPMLGSASELPVFASSGFGEPAVIVPLARGAANNNKLLYGLVAVVGLLAVVAVVMVVVLLLGDKPTVAPGAVAIAPSATSEGKPGELPAAGAAPGGEVAPPAAPAGSAAVPPQPENPGSPDSPGSPDNRGAGDPPATDPPAAKPREPRKPDNKADKKDRGSKERPAPTPSKPEPAPERPSKPEKSSDCDAVACLVDPNQACCAKKGGSRPSSGATASKPDSNLPEQLDSSMIKAGIDKVKGRAQSCGAKSSAKGAVKVKIKATPDGRVGSVDVVSSPDAGLGTCVAGALRGATFAKTQRGMGFAYTLTF
jgi:predicted Zn finger-like uncharacterized protein